MDKAVWQKHEKDVQKRLGLSSTIASGNQYSDIGDGSTGHNRKVDFPMIVDCKCTEKKSYSVNSEFMEQWLEKAAQEGKMFALPIRFAEAKVKDYIVLTLDDFEMLFEFAKRGIKWSE